MGYTGARVASALGQGARGIGDVLMRISHNQQAREEAEREAALDEERMALLRRQVQGDEQARNFEWAQGERTRADRRRDMGYDVQEVAPLPSLIGMGGNTMGEALMRVASGGGMQAPNFVEGDFDATRSVDYRTAVAKGEKENELAITRARELAKLRGPDRPNYQFVDTGAGRGVFDPQSGEVRPYTPPAQEAGGGGPGTLAEAARAAGLKPADMSVVDGALSIIPLLEGYRAKSEEFSAQGGLNRVRSRIPGVASPDQDELIGQLGSMKQGMMMSLKNLEGMGALQAGEIRMLEDWISDATNNEAILRGPEFVDAGLRGIEDYINQKLRVWAANRGIDPSLLPRAGTNRTETGASGGGFDPERARMEYERGGR